MIYAARRLSDGHIKIGTSNHVAERLRKLRKIHKSPIVLIGLWEGGHREEKAVHYELWPFNANHSWTGMGYHRGPQEWFRPARKVRSLIAQRNILTKELRSALGLESQLTYRKAAK